MASEPSIHWRSLHSTGNKTTFIQSHILLNVLIIPYTTAPFTLLRGTSCSATSQISNILYIYTRSSVNGALCVHSQCVTIKFHSCKLFALFANAIKHVRVIGCHNCVLTAEDKSGIPKNHHNFLFYLLHRTL